MGEAATLEGGWVEGVVEALPKGLGRATGSVQHNNSLNSAREGVAALTTAQGAGSKQDHMDSLPLDLNTTLFPLLPFLLPRFLSLQWICALPQCLSKQLTSALISARTNLPIRPRAGAMN